MAGGEFVERLCDAARGDLIAVTNRSFASEAPAVSVAVLFVLAGRAANGLTTLISDKINQWTLLVGMLPMAIALNDGGEIQAPMGRAIIGGVITSTLLTLVVVPVL